MLAEIYQQPRYCKTLVDLTKKMSINRKFLLRTLYKTQIDGEIHVSKTAEGPLLIR